jgi:hypothetical protein
MKTLQKSLKLSLLKLASMFLTLAFICNISFGQDLDGYLALDHIFREVANITILKEELPQLTDENSATLILALTNKDLLLPKKHSLLTEFEALQDICSSASSWSQLYLFNGLEKKLKADATREEADKLMQKLVSSNVQKYQNELQYFQSFNTKCAASQLTLIAVLLQGEKNEQLTATRIEGIRRMQSGALVMHLSALVAIQSKDLNLSYKKALIEELALNTEVFSQTISPQYRKLIIDIISKSSLNIDAELHSYLNIITKSMSNESCEKLCAVR